MSGPLRQPQLSIVIPCSRPERVAACISALRAQAGDAYLEVFAVGNVAGLESTDTHGFAFHAIACAEPHANVRRNMALVLSRAPRVAFMDDDVIPQPGWVAAALSLDPGSNRVLTGPERPVDRGRLTSLIFSVCANILVEGAGGHFNTRRTRTSWRRVPFCNCVVPRTLFDRIGLPATNIPWDMDDLEFFTRARPHMVFENEPRLAVWHDRYPDSVVEFIAERWVRRVRTGEKLMERPDLYCQVPAILASAVVPWFALLLFWLLGWSAGAVVSSLAFAYGAVLAAYLETALRVGGSPRSALAYLALVGLAHVTSMIAIQVGAARGLLALGAPRAQPSPSPQGTADVAVGAG